MPLLTLSNIRPPHARLRENIGSLEELKQSIKEEGLLQQIIVRKVGTHYEVVAGHRRYLACLELGHKEIETYEVNVDDKKAFEIGLSENIQRKSMDIIEEGRAFSYYVSTKGYGAVSDLARKIGVSEKYIRDRLITLNLPSTTSEAIRTGSLSLTHARELAPLPTKEASELADEAIAKGLTAETTRKAVQLIQHGFSADQAVRHSLEFPDWKVPKDTTHYNVEAVARESIYLSLEKCLKTIDIEINRLPQAEQKEWISRVRYPCHELVNQAIKMRKQGDKKR
jgi:ParB family chromosome partitioning protein